MRRTERALVHLLRTTDGHGRDVIATVSGCDVPGCSGPGVPCGGGHVRLFVGAELVVDGPWVRVRKAPRLVELAEQEDEIRRLCEAMDEAEGWTTGAPS